MHYPLLMNHDASESDPTHFTCQPFTYRELLNLEGQAARAIFRASEWLLP